VTVAIGHAPNQPVGLTDPTGDAPGLFGDRRGGPQPKDVVPGSELSCWCVMTLEQDRADIERVAVSWQDVPGIEQEAMAATLGAMLEYLDPGEDAERQLRLDAGRLLRKIEASLGRGR
jgi:hypothetical protein